MKLIVKSFFYFLLLSSLLTSCSRALKSGGSTKNTKPRESSENGAGATSLSPGFNGRVIKDVSYATNTNYKGEQENLTLDVYIPDKGNTDHKYPLYVFMHGGGFLRGNKNTGVAFCSGLAAQGFVVASINYRIGWSDAHTTSNLCAGDSVELIKAIYRAIQDANASMRFLASKASEYEINDKWIFIGGQSAGGVTALNTAYVTQEEANANLPNAISMLGALNSSGNNLTNPFTIKGVANMWGGIGSPDIITKSNAVPTIFFHGEKDRIAPVNKGYIYSCPNFMVAYGSIPIYNRLKELGVSAVAHIDPQGGHGVFSNEFRIANVSCFFKEVMLNKHVEGYYVGEKNSCK